MAVWNWKHLWQTSIKFCFFVEEKKRERQFYTERGIEFPLVKGWYCVHACILVDYEMYGIFVSNVLQIYMYLGSDIWTHVNKQYTYCMIRKAGFIREVVLS